MSKICENRSLFLFYFHHTFHNLNRAEIFWKILIDKQIRSAITILGIRFSVV